MLGVRLDSGDLAALSIDTRRILNEAGFPHASIVGSSDLDEYQIAEIKRRGGKIDVWGVGTRLATAYDQPALGGVYKLAALADEQGRWHGRLKLSETPEKTFRSWGIASAPVSEERTIRGRRGLRPRDAATDATNAR